MQSEINAAKSGFELRVMPGADVAVISFLTDELDIRL